MRRTLAALCLIGLAATEPAPAQELVWGPPLVDGLGGPLGYGEPHDGLGEVPIDAAAPAGLTYYGTNVDRLFVNWIGSISLGFIYPEWESNPYPREDFLLGPNPVLAIFENSSEFPGFRLGGGGPTFTYVAVLPPLDDAPGQIVATWHRVTERPDDPRFGEQLFNDWQLILTLTDDPGRYTVEMRYSRCEWQHGFERHDELPVIGFDAGDGRDGPGWTWPGSLSEDSRLLCVLSNVREPGIFRYEVIDGVPTGCGPDLSAAQRRGTTRLDQM